MLELPGFTLVRKNGNGGNQLTERGLRVRITKGAFVLTRAAIEALGSPKYVHVLHNRETRQIVFLAAAEDGNDAFKVSIAGSINCAKFIRTASLPHDALPVQVGNGGLTVQY